MRRCICFAGLRPSPANPPRHGERACGQRVASPLDAQPSVAQTGATFNYRQADRALLWEGAAGAPARGMLVRTIERSLLGWRADHAEKPS